MPTSCDELDELRGRLGVPESAREDIAAGRPQPGSSDWHEMERLRRELISGTDPPNWPTPASTAPASRRWLHLWALLGVIPHVLELNGSRGIPESITWATLLDVGVNVERFAAEHGHPGFDGIFWCAQHVRGTIYRLGRLSFKVWTVAFEPDPACARATGPLVSMCRPPDLSYQSTATGRWCEHARSSKTISTETSG